jgi:hypothetical protein
LAEWLAERLSEDVPTIVGIDHGFSFPLRYFEVARALVGPPGMVVIEPDAVDVRQLPETNG